jgi:hypothetical protein
MRYKLLFDKINVINSGCLKKTKLYIDVETLEIFKGLGDVSKKLKRSIVRCCESIKGFQRIDGRLIEEFDEWQQWDNWEKERYTKKNNIFFYYGDD